MKTPTPLSTELQNQLLTQLNNASHELLVALVQHLVDQQPEQLRKSIEFLTENEDKHETSQLLPVQQPTYDADDDWYELTEQIEEATRYYQPDILENLVDDIDHFANTLATSNVDVIERNTIRDSALNLASEHDQGIDESLIEVALSCCKNPEEYIDLGQTLEALYDGQYQEYAIRAYKNANDEYNYMRLRLTTLNTDSDFKDLASFYWDSGDHQQAIKTAHQGLKVTSEHSICLREFIADAALQQGDRTTYLEQYFTIATRYTNLESYQAFEQRCEPDEWQHYKPLFADYLQSETSLSVAKIHHYNQNHNMAMRYFTNDDIHTRYYSKYDDYSLAKSYEQHYPNEILTYYRAVIGPLDESHSRGTYAFYAGMMVRLRTVLVDRLDRLQDWRRYATNVKARNVRRPAFQDECRKVIVDWDKI